MNPRNGRFGDQLGRYRLQAGKSQEQLATCLGVHRSTIERWEHSETLPKSRARVEEIVRCLGLTDKQKEALLKAVFFDTPSPIWNVPHQRNPFFTGRDDLFDQLDQHLAPPVHPAGVETRRVALTQPHAIKGLGGIGKTQIAVEYAYRAREQGRYTHTFWVNAANDETIIASFVSIANLLPSVAIQHETDQRKLVGAIKRWLEQCKERWLLIFDNADEVALVRGYLPQQGNGSILLTTRAGAVGSLATPVEVETMGIVEGTHLLLRRAQRFEHASEEEIKQAANIVVALDHFPLALDQAGAYIEETQCSFVNYLDLYRNHRHALLARRGMQVVNYPDTVAATWSLSFQKVEHVNPAAAELLRLCAFLAPDNIPEELVRDGAAHWPSLLQQASADLFAFHQMIAELLKFSLVKRLVEVLALSIHRLVQVVIRDSMELETQHQWAERAVRAINTVFPENPQDLAAWPQCLRYLDQAQACYGLIEHYGLAFVEAASVLNRTGLYLYDHALYAIAEPLHQRALSICEQQLGATHPDVATHLNNLAVLYDDQGKYEQSEPLLHRALSIRERGFGPYHPGVAISLNNLAMHYYNQSKYEQAEPLLQRALSISERNLGFNHLNVATNLNNLALLYKSQSRYKQAADLYQRALSIRQQALASTHPDLAQSLSNLAGLYLDQGEYDQAQTLSQQALSIFEQTFGSDHPSIAIGLNNLAELYRIQGRYDEAEPRYLRALSIFEQAFGFDHPTVAQSLNNLAMLYRNQERYEQAESLYQRAFTIFEQTLGPGHPDTMRSLNNLAILYRNQERHERAESLYRDALSSFEQALGPHHPNVAQCLNDLALLYKSQGKQQQAEALYQRALSIRQRVLGPHHPDVAQSLNNLAVLYNAQCKYEQAEALYQRALSIFEQTLGSHHINVAQCLNNLAALYYNQRKYDQAESLYQQAHTIFEQTLGPQHSKTARVLANYAILLRKMGRKTEAVKLLTQATTADTHSGGLLTEKRHIVDGEEDLGIAYKTDE